MSSQCMYDGCELLQAASTVYSGEIVKLVAGLEEAIKKEYGNLVGIF